MTAISQLPPSIVKLAKLEELSLSNCNILGRLPEDIGSLHSLEYLNVCGSNISCLPKSISKLLYLTTLNVQYCNSLSELPGQLPPNLVRLYADDQLGLKSIRDLLVKCIKLEEISFSESNNVHWVPASTNQNLLKFLDQFLRTFIQCHFHQRQCFHISFPIGGRIPKSFGCNFSINLKQSWYTDNLKGFLICYRGDKRQKDGPYYELTCQLSDPGRKHTLSYSVSQYTVPHAPFLSITYIPYKSFWLPLHCKERKSPNDYSLFEVSTTQIATCGRVYLVYEKKGEIGFSGAFVPLEPSYASNHLQAYDEHNTATNMVLHLGYEIEADLEVDQKEHETQNVELIRVCDGPSRKIGDASRKRKRSNKRKKIIKEAST